MLASSRAEAAPSGLHFIPAVPQLAVRGDAALEVGLTGIPVGEFRDPFFTETIQRYPGADVQTVSVPRETLSALARGEATAAPAGIIFQMSRCGSTALANILRCIPGCSVFSEPLPVNDLLTPPADWTGEQMQGGLRWLAQRFSVACDGQPFIWKLRSWNVLFAAQVCAAFPRTPWVFLTRDPVEVGVSVLTKPPTWLRAYASESNPFLSFLPARARLADREAYVAHMLASFANSIAQLDKSRGLLVRYEEFGPAAWAQVARHFDRPPSPAIRRAMLREARLYSKDRSRTVPFTGDVAAKQLQADDRLRDAMREIAGPAFQQLIEEWERS